MPDEPTIPVPMTEAQWAAVKAVHAWADHGSARDALGALAAAYEAAVARPAESDPGDASTRWDPYACEWVTTREVDAGLGGGA
jgi:hypothetical protein